MKKGGKHLSALSGNKMTAIRSGRNKTNAKTSDRQVFSVQRICAASDCGREFTAYNNTTLYCCPACYQREYYKRHKKKIAKQRAVRNAKQMLSLPVPAPTIKHSLPDDRPTPKQERNPITQQPVQGIPQSADIVSVAEAAKRLHVCRQTIYNMEAAGTITILHLTSRLSFIRWSDMLALFDHPGAHDKPVLPTSGRRTARKPTKQKPADETWWTSEQACRHYRITRHCLYMTISRFKIPKKKVGTTTLYSFLHLDKARKYIDGK